MTRRNPFLFKRNKDAAADPAGTRMLCGRNGRRKYIIAAAAAVAVLFLGTAPATYSYLTASSDQVVNTFAGGAISIVLDETLVNTDGVSVGDARAIENSYKITPGASLTKDPTITVLAGSEDTYLFIYVENELPEEYFSIDYSDSWTVVATTGTKTLYMYQSVVESSDEDITLEPLFTTVTVSEELSSEQVEALGELQMIIQSYAIQAEGVDEADAIAMAIAYFEEAFSFSFDDEDTTVDVNALSDGSSGSADADADTIDAAEGAAEDEAVSASEDAAEDEINDVPDGAAAEEAAADADEAEDGASVTDNAAADDDGTSSDEGSADDTAGQLPE